MAKKNSGFSIDEENLAWLKEQAKAKSRSASGQLDYMLTQLRNEGKTNE